MLLVRHAPTPETGVRLTGRLPGVSLGAAGLDAARAVADRLREVELAAIYTSPIERTFETAEVIADGRGLTPDIEDGLLEIDFGTWAGRTLKSLARLKAWRTVQHTPSMVRFPEGESFAEAQSRAVDACRRLSQRHRKRTVAAVTHADVIKLVTAYALGTPLDLFQRILIAPASVTVIDLSDDAPPHVRAVNTDGTPETWR